MAGEGLTSVTTQSKIVMLSDLLSEDIRRYKYIFTFVAARFEQRFKQEAGNELAKV